LEDHADGQLQDGTLGPVRKDEQGTDPQFLRDGVRLLAQELMDAEVNAAIGAEPYERTDKRITSRNGFREREWDTRVGTVELAIPKLRQGSYFPSLLEPRWPARDQSPALSTCNVTNAPGHG
jgi:transposase-like protein